VPNLFGEVPAVQVSGVRASSKVDAELQKSVEEALKGATSGCGDRTWKSPCSASASRTPKRSLRARDAVQSKVGPGYVVALNLVPNTPHWLQAIGSKPCTWASDLRGGVHFLLRWT
jgi:preprotein translocase subunit SecD